MQLTDFLQEMTPDVYRVLKESIELGRWPNGQLLSDEERNASLQAMIAWEHDHLPEEQRTGYMPVQCNSQSQAKVADEPASILRFKD